jgi:hypothetical protein
VPVALVGVHSPDQLALRRLAAKVSLPNACCFQMLRLMSRLPSV